MNVLYRYFFGAIDSVRPWLFLRLFFFLLAFDCWLDLIPHGGRYGFNNFNVAHFSVLDALQPVPSSGTYVAVVFLAGIASFVMAFAGPTRLLLGSLFVLYTYGWMMSMLDSYQHHYLISILLFSCMFFPISSSSDVFSKPSRSSVLWGGAFFALGFSEIIVGIAGADTLFTRIWGPGASIATPKGIWFVRFVLVLFGGLLAFLPDEKNKKTTRQRKTRSAKKSKKKKEGKETAGERLLPAWAYVSLCTSCAIVYFYTAVSKLSVDWRQGYALRRLGRTELFHSLEEHATHEGLWFIGSLSDDEFWKLMAAGAIAIQVVSCAGYLLAPLYDRNRKTKFGKYTGWILLLAPLFFHLGAEIGLVLDIGWFSFYMILVAFVAHLPGQALRTMSEGWSAPFRWAHVVLKKELQKRKAMNALLLCVSCFVVITLSMKLDLPGTKQAGWLCSLALISSSIWMYRNEAFHRIGIWSLGTLVAVSMMYISVIYSDVRFDFYRFVGGEYRRHGEYELALQAYEKANAYNPAPWCLYRGTDRQAELVECYSNSARAQEIAIQYQGYEVRRRDRERQEDEMRMRLERTPEGQ